MSRTSSASAMFLIFSCLICYARNQSLDLDQLDIDLNSTLPFESPLPLSSTTAGETAPAPSAVASVAKERMVRYPSYFEENYPSDTKKLDYLKAMLKLLRRDNSMMDDRKIGGSVIQNSLAEIEPILLDTRRSLDNVENRAHFPKIDITNKDLMQDFWQNNQLPGSILQNRLLRSEGGNSNGKICLDGHDGMDFYVYDVLGRRRLVGDCTIQIKSSHNSKLGLHNINEGTTKKISRVDRSSIGSPSMIAAMDLMEGNLAQGDSIKKKSAIERPWRKVRLPENGRLWYSNEQQSLDSMKDYQRQIFSSKKFIHQQNNKVKDEVKDVKAHGGQFEGPIVDIDQAGQELLRADWSWQINMPGLNKIINKIYVPKKNDSSTKRAAQIENIEQHELVQYEPIVNTSDVTDFTPVVRCASKQIVFEATRKDTMGNKCSGLLYATICEGSCDTGEIADWLFPYKKSIHKVCAYGKRRLRKETLTNCNTPKAFLSLSEYQFVDATSCVCQRCNSDDTYCMGTLSKMKDPLQWID